VNDKEQQAAPIPFARPFIGAEEEEAVLRVLRSGWLTTAGEALAFESEFARFLGGGVAALAVHSATSALHLALEACGIKEGDVVLVPSYTFPASAEVARYLGAEIAFVDCALGSLLVDVDLLERTVRRLRAGQSAYQTGGPCGMPRAVIPVHYGGLCCDMEALNTVARRYNLAVVEDAAHAFPAYTEKGGAAGTLGDAGAFSFYATKTLTTGEGGMIVSGNAALIRRAALLRCHGIDRPAWNRYTETKASWYYEVTEAGYKYNMPDILAAIGRVQLKRANDLWAMRKAIAERYDKAFGGKAAFSLSPSHSGNARHLYPLRVNSEKCRFSRDELIRKLQAEGIGVSVHFIPLHLMPYYKKRYGLREDAFPEALGNFKRVISLPIWPGMSGAEVDRVIAALEVL